jgi:protein gp37
VGALVASQRDGGVSWTNPPGYRGESWNVVRGCAERCGAHCWAERQAIRQVRGNYRGLVESTPNGPRWTGRQRFAIEKLDDPLHWREPRCVAVSLMGDLFGSGIPDRYIADVFAVMIATRRHIYCVLTKQTMRRMALLASPEFWETVNECGAARGWVTDWCPCGPADPPTNVVQLVSCSDQAMLDALVPDLLATPAACRGVSLEPLLGPVNAHLGRDSLDTYSAAPPLDTYSAAPPLDTYSAAPPLDWIIVGPETGPGARPCNPEWILSVVDQCREAGVACHVKAVPLADGRISHDPAEWPDALRVRQWPEVFR